MPVEEEDVPYEEIHFSRIPEEFLSAPEAPVQESPRSQPALDANVASPQIAKDDHQITKGQGEEDTEL